MGGGAVSGPVTTGSGGTRAQPDITAIAQHNNKRIKRLGIIYSCVRRASIWSEVWMALLFIS